MKNRPRVLNFVCESVFDKIFKILDVVPYGCVSKHHALTVSTKAKAKPTKLHKRKHQIGSLYFDMKHKEMQLAGVQEA